jgi:hypothetical protein
MIERDEKGRIASKVPITRLVIYKNDLKSFLTEVYYNSKYNKPFRTFKEFQFDWLCKQRNERKQRQIMKHKKKQAKW